MIISRYQRRQRLRRHMNVIAFMLVLFVIALLSAGLIIMAIKSH